MIEYGKLEAIVESSLKNFKLIAEYDLEEKIILYKKKNPNITVLGYIEYEAGDEFERDLIHNIRPQPDTAYLFFKQSISENDMLTVETTCLGIANNIGTNAFTILSDGGVNLYLYVKIKEIWFWLPMQPVSKLQKLNQQKLAFSEINMGEKFFTSMLKS